MKVGRKQLFKRGVMAAAAIGVLVVAQPTISGATHDPAHVSNSAGTPGVSFNTSVPIGPISVPIDFSLCVGTTCVSDDNVGAVSGGVLKLTFTAPSNAVTVDMAPAACPKTASGEQLLGSVINLTAGGSAGGASVSGSFTDKDGNVRPLGPLSIPAQNKTQTSALRLCALSPVA